MPQLRLDEELSVHYAEDDFTDPWRESETIVLLHGLAESGAVWFAWVPWLARRFRVVRPDLRGFGRSSRPDDPSAFPWSPAGFADDLARFLDAAGIKAAHVVGSRLGSTVAAWLAAERPDLVRSLALVSGLARGSDIRAMATSGAAAHITLADSARMLEEQGLGAWAAATQRGRIGADAPDAQLAWWTELMAQSDRAMVAAILRIAPTLDLDDVLPLIQAPTLVLAAADSRVQPIEATRAWASRIPRAQVVALPGDSPHLAALRPDECAGRVLSFIDSLEA
jgi:3-oxoadipate enol-lactonase